MRRGRTDFGKCWRTQGWGRKWRIWRMGWKRISRTLPKASPSGKSNCSAWQEWCSTQIESSSWTKPPPTLIITQILSSSSASAKGSTSALSLPLPIDSIPWPIMIGWWWWTKEPLLRKEYLLNYWRRTGIFMIWSIKQARTKILSGAWQKKPTAIRNIDFFIHKYKYWTFFCLMTYDKFQLESN